MSADSTPVIYRTMSTVSYIEWEREMKGIILWFTPKSHKNNEEFFKKKKRKMCLPFLMLKFSGLVYPLCRDKRDTEFLLLRKTKTLQQQESML